MLVGFPGAIILLPRALVHRVDRVEKLIDPGLTRHDLLTQIDHLPRVVPDRTQLSPPACQHASPHLAQRTIAFGPTGLDGVSVAS